MAEFAPLVLPTEVASLGLPDDALEELDVCHECGQLAPAGPVSLGAAGGGLLLSVPPAVGAGAPVAVAVAHEFAACS